MRVCVCETIGTHKSKLPCVSRSANGAAHCENAVMDIGLLMHSIKCAMHACLALTTGRIYVCVRMCVRVCQAQSLDMSHLLDGTDAAPVEPIRKSVPSICI